MCLHVLLSWSISDKSTFNRDGYYRLKSVEDALNCCEEADFGFEEEKRYD